MPNIPPPREAAAWLERIIRDFVNRSPENTLLNPAREKAFDDPLVGFARGDDPIFQDYKRHVGPFHWTPGEVFDQNFPGAVQNHEVFNQAHSPDRFKKDTGKTNFLPVSSGELTVISWILPQTEATKSDNRAESRYPSERWARARVFGEEVNTKLRRHVVDTLTENGIQAVAPQLDPKWEIQYSDTYGRASTWSERHAAHAAGLGAFGLCDGLITSKGKAMRTGSVVARIQAEPTLRPYSSHQAYCLFLTRGICGKCIKRCPAEAISEKGKDKLKCYTYIREVTTGYIKDHYDIQGYACGLCQTGVPCESRIPAPAKE